MLLNNQATFSFEDLYTIFGANSIFNMDTDFIAKGVSTDTRNIKKGNIFVALEGENFDGHNYLVDAVSNGAIALIISSRKLADGLQVPEGISIIKTANTLTALGVLGRYHRDRFDIPLIAVAGSNGKTTTKDMIAAFISPKFNVLKTEKNYNNKVGVPLTLLQLEGQHTACVLEIGTNEFGEIQYLCEMSNPTHGLVTNIGAEHLQEFGDLDGVEMEEATLFGWVRQQNGHAYINVSDKRLDKYVEHIEKKTAYSYDESDANHIGKIEENGSQQKITISNDKSALIEYNLNIAGRTNAINSIAAASVALSFEIDTKDIIEAIESYKLPTYKEGYARMAINIFGGLTIINDTYNANSDSMVQALDVLNSEGKGKKKIAVLGDMRELGDASSAEHIKIIQKAIAIADTIYLVGEEFSKAFSTLKEKETSIDLDKIKTFKTLEEASDNIEKTINNAAILYKGSRGMQIEKLIKLPS